MAIKGFNRDLAPSMQEASTGAPQLKKYYVLNVGIKSLQKVKCFNILLKRMDTGVIRNLIVYMHKDEPNWAMLRKLLGNKNPPAINHVAAAAALRDLLADTGGIEIAERRAKDSRTSNVFIVTKIAPIVVQEKDHPGIMPFKSHPSCKDVTSLLVSEDAAVTPAQEVNLDGEPVNFPLNLDEAPDLSDI